MRRFFALPLLVLAATASAGTRVDVDGVPHVRNDAKPAAGTETLELSDPWIRGDDSDDIIFGQIAQIVRDQDGNSYVMDQQLGEVQVFDGGGEWLRAIGRKGEGPGEFNPNNAADMFFTPGGMIGIAQRFPGRVIQLTTDGVAESDFPLPSDEGFVTVNAGYAAGDDLVVGGTLMSRTDTGMERIAYIRLFGGDGSVRAEMFRTPYDFDFTALVFKEKELFDATNCFTVDGSGRIFVAQSWDDYAIHVYDADGKLLHVIEREYDPGERSDAEVERVKNRYQININGRQATIEIAKANRAVREIIPRPDGGIWVRTGLESADLPAGCLARLDEFDAEGNFTRQILLKVAGNAGDDQVLVRGDAVYVVPGANIPAPPEDEAVEADTEPLMVQCYRLPDNALAQKSK